MGNEYNESLVAAIQGELALAGVVVLHGLLLVDLGPLLGKMLRVYILIQNAAK